MRKKKESKLNIRLMAVFFVAIFLISLVSSVVFLRLLNTLEKEARTVNMEQFNISVGRLDSELNKLVSNYRNLSRHELFRYYRDNINEREEQKNEKENGVMYTDFRRASGSHRRAV